MAGRLEGKVCVVTGASGGIGSATVAAFQREGATVAGVDLMDGAPGDLSLSVDVTDGDAVSDMYAQVKAQCGAIHVLFNNAGISPNDDDSILRTGLEAWQRVQDVNLKSVYLCCHHGIPHLLENEGPLRGSVINTASFVATLGAATSQISYTASKGGVLAMSREMGVEFARQGVRVNALSPAPWTPRCCASCSPRIPSAPRAASSTCPWAGSAAPRRWRTRCSSSPPTSRRSSRRRTSWSTAGSAGRT